MSEARRKYHAPQRRAAAAQTRERICAAAETLFLRAGYARTSIRAVARAAGVAEATIYLAFPTKGALLDAVILRAVRGGERLEEIIAGPPEQLLQRLAASNAALMARAAPLIALGESASLMDAELRPLRERAHRNLRAAFRRAADRLDAAGLLRDDAQAAADTLYAIASETTYLRMGLEPEDYARWLSDALALLLTHDANRV